MLKVHLNFHIAGHFIREPFIIIIIIRQSTALRDDYIVHKFENTLLKVSIYVGTGGIPLSIFQKTIGLLFLHNRSIVP